MKQFIYCIITQTGENITAITRSEAIEKINNNFSTERFYKPITPSILDRLIINGNSNLFIKKAIKIPINEYYRTQINKFVINDKKHRTEDALKKAINRYVVRLYHIGEKRIEEEEEEVNEEAEEEEVNEEVNEEAEEEEEEEEQQPNNDVIVIKLHDEIETTETINNEIETTETNEIVSKNNDCELETETENMLVSYKPKQRKHILFKAKPKTIKHKHKRRKKRTLKVSKLG